MSAFITALTDTTTGISATTLWTEVAHIVPLLVILLPFAFGYYVVRKSVKGAAKGKVKF